MNIKHIFDKFIKTFRSRYRLRLDLNLIMFEKDWGMANLKLLFARNNDSGWAGYQGLDAAGKAAAGYAKLY